MPKGQRKDKEKISHLQTAKELVDRLNHLDIDECYEFAKKHKAAIKNEYELSDVLNILQEEERLRLTRHCPNLICDFNSCLTIMKALPNADQEKFAVKYVEYVKSKSEYEKIQYQLSKMCKGDSYEFALAYFLQCQSISEIIKPLLTIADSRINHEDQLENKKQVVNKLKEIVRSDTQLLELINLSDPTVRCFIVENCKVNIESPIILAKILQQINSVSNDEKSQKRSNYALEHDIKIDCAAELIAILHTLNKDNRLEYYFKSGYKPKNIDEKLRIVLLLKTEDALYHFEKSGLKIETFDQLCLLLSSVDSESRMKIAFNHKNLIPDVDSLINILNRIPLNRWAFLCKEKAELIKSPDDFWKIIKAVDSIDDPDNSAKNIKVKISVIFSNKINSWEQHFALLSFMSENELVRFIMTSKNKNKAKLPDVLNELLNYLQSREGDPANIVSLDYIYRNNKQYVCTIADLAGTLSVFDRTNVTGRFCTELDMSSTDIIDLNHLLNSIQKRILFDHLDKINNISDVALIMKVIHGKNRIRLLHKKGDLIKNAHQLVSVMKSFPRSKRWELAIRYSELIKSVSDLISVGAKLPTLQCVDLYLRFNNSIKTFDDLLQIANSIHDMRIPSDDTTLNKVSELFKERYCLVKSIEEALKIAPYLKGIISDEHVHSMVLDFTRNHVHQASDVIGSLKLFSIDPIKNDIPQEWKFVRLHKDKIQTLNDLALLIENMKFNNDEQVSDVEQIHELFSSLIQTSEDRELIRSKLTYWHQVPFDKKFQPPEPAVVASTPSRRGLFSRTFSQFKSAAGEDASNSVRPSMNRL